MYTSTIINFDYPDNLLIKLFKMEELNQFKESKDFKIYKDVLTMQEANYVEINTDTNPLVYCVRALCVGIFCLFIGMFSSNELLSVLLSLTATIVYLLLAPFLESVISKTNKQILCFKLEDLKKRNKTLAIIDDIIIQEEHYRHTKLMEYLSFLEKIEDYDNINIYLVPIGLDFKEHTFDFLVSELLFEEILTGTHFTFAYNLVDPTDINSLLTKLTVFEVNKDTLELKQKV